MSEYSSEYEFPATPTDNDSFDWLSLLQTSSMPFEEQHLDLSTSTAPSAANFSIEKFDHQQQLQESKMSLIDSLLADLDCRPLICRTAFTDDAMYGLSSDGYNVSQPFNMPTCVNPNQIHAPSPSREHHDAQTHDSSNLSLQHSIESFNTDLIPTPPLATEDIYSEIRRRTSDETLNQYGSRMSRESSLAARLPSAESSNATTPKKEPVLRRKKAQIFSKIPLDISTPVKSNSSSKNQISISTMQQCPANPTAQYQAPFYFDPSESSGSSVFSMQMPPLTPSSAANVSFSSPHTPIHYFGNSMTPTTPKSAAQTPGGGAQYFHPFAPTSMSRHEQQMFQMANRSPISPSNHNSRKLKSLPKRATSPAMPTLSFVNYTCADAEKLSAAVAPSGNGKRKAQQIVEQKQQNKKIKASDY